MFRPQDHFTQNERKILTFVLIMLFLGLGIKYLYLIADDQVFEGDLKAVSENRSPIDIRTADADQLQELPRVGPKLAERIIAYRTEHGFKNINDLLQVKGIGEVTLERISPYLVKFGEVETSQETVNTARKDSVFDINTGSIDDFIGLPGIGEVKAQRIIDRRNEIGKFNNVNELIEIKGIGEKTLAKILPYIKCED